MKRAAVQGALFDEVPTAADSIVNVASVPQLSPFRYPGGKTWLVPQMRLWLSSKPKKVDHLVELFAGGAIVGLTAAAEGLAKHVTLIELDPDVSSVWKTIFEDDAAWLAKKILNFDLTYENLTEVLNTPSGRVRDRAFQTILKNRTYHGGILAKGSGLIKTGENGKGLLSRWYPETLAKRITNLAHLKDRVTVIEGDALEYLEKNLKDKKITYFIDPPYTAPGKSAGRRLYNFNEIDHEKLFDLCKKSSGDFLMTYDDAESVREMAAARNFKITRVPMKNTHHAKMYELLITPL